MKTTRRAFRRPPRLTRRQRRFLLHRLGRAGQLSETERGVADELLEGGFLGFVTGYTVDQEGKHHRAPKTTFLTRKGREALCR